MKMMKSAIPVLIGAAFCVTSAFGDVVSFNSPSQWTTSRSDVIVLKSQLDTAKLPKKQVSIVLSKIENGKKKQVLSKQFKVTDYSQEFNLGSVQTSLLGGKDYLRVDWSVVGSTDKGSLFPIGIVNLDKIDKVAELHVAKVPDAVDAANAGALVKDKKITDVKGSGFVLLWGPKALSIVCKKGQTGVLRFAFDGKNGKNAFISYPDRMVEYHAANDSIASIMYERVALTDSLNFVQKNWQNDIKKSVSKDYCVITIPWPDLGILAVDGRMMGFAALSMGDKSAVAGAYPEKAKLLIPGSWGTVVLDK
jgi:hypothetical protein